MPLPGSTNLTTEFLERPYAAYHEQSPPPEWFRSIPPTYIGPSPIVYPDTLNMLERAEVNAWLGSIESQRPVMLARCTHRAAIAKITEYIAYYADPAYRSWADACRSDHIAQWRLFLADALLANKVTVPATLDSSGAIGSAPNTVPYVQGTNLT